MSLSLGRMKTIAVMLLLSAVGLYVLALWQRPHHFAWGYVAAFAEAAMIGAVADWFAVVALFRRPLGLPIAHTAVIVNNKARIGHALATFMGRHFFNTHYVQTQLKAHNAPQKIGHWLAQSERAQALVSHLSGALSQVIQAMPESKKSNASSASDSPVVVALVQALHQFNGPGLTAQLLQHLIHSEHYTSLLNSALKHLSLMLSDDALTEKIADLLSDEMKYLRPMGLDGLASRYVSGKMVAGVVKLMTDMHADTHHPLRLRLRHRILLFVDQLQQDSDLKQRTQEIQYQLLTHPAVLTQLQAAWLHLQQVLKTDLTMPNSALQAQLAQSLAHYGAQLAQHPEQQAKLMVHLLQAAPGLVDQVRTGAERYIAARVQQWDAVQMSLELEASIGVDLQFIRINGTLVGGLVGLFIYTLSQLFGPAF
jgi:uncharacterized membrane-anchored protein YjiN (DUF445 family)